MQHAERKLLQQLAAEVGKLCSDMLELERSVLDHSPPLHKVHSRSARNLVHYLALRRHDLRSLQRDLASIGLSSLGRSEGHVLSAIQAVYHVLSALLGQDDELCLFAKSPVKLGDGTQLLNRNAEALLGRKPSGRTVRIMVTMPTEASTNYELVRDLVENGMDCMRINCAHDNPEVWLGMIRNLQKAREETGRFCCIEMDLAGPKLRTGPIEPGPAVLRCRPQRDEFGRVVEPARLRLISAENEPSPDAGITSLPVSKLSLTKLRRGDIIRFRDARDAPRVLKIAKVEGSICWAETDRTAYFVPGIKLRVISGETANQAKRRRLEGRIGSIPATMQRLLLKQGEVLILTRTIHPGKLARRDKQERVTVPAQIGVTLPAALEHVKTGEPIWFDDGKIGGLIRSVTEKEIHVEITQARPEGEYLDEGKGINLPSTRIDLPALTAEDIEHLKIAVEHADFIGYSFVRTEGDVNQLIAHLREFKKESLGIVLKIETREAFDNLPGLVLAAMALRTVGVMIARGDLAVECGYQRLAEVQEEILWICEAAHIPVIWATQVLETLSKKGSPSRSEITDAAMGERAECVMLNKGPYVVAAVKALDDILKRMQAHQEKKRSMLRRLRVASSFIVTDRTKG